MIDAEEPMAGFHAVILAGGPGTRLWPLSRMDRPKFLLDLVGSGRSLLAQTWDRLDGLATVDHMLVVTGRQHAPAVARQLPRLATSNLLCEPSARDTAAAICLAAAVVANRSPGAVIGAFPADHVVQDVDEFDRAIREAVVAARAGYLVTIGIDPSHPSTALGYIQLGEPMPIEGTTKILRARRFVEKPDAETAVRYAAEGTWRWNAGMFVVRAEVLLAELERYRPALHAGLTKIAAAWDTESRDEVLAAAWPSLEKISVDYAVAEPAAAAGRVLVRPAALGWDDIGDWAALVALLAPPDGSGPAVLGARERVHTIDTTGLVVAEGDRAVSVQGLSDVVVIDTPDALLVTTRQRAQEVKHLVEELKRRGQSHLT